MVLKEEPNVPHQVRNHFLADAHRVGYHKIGFNSLASRAQALSSLIAVELAP